MKPNCASNRRVMVVEIIREDKYVDFTGICNNFASISNVLVYNNRLSRSSRSVSDAIVKGLYMDFNSCPILRNSRQAFVSVSACLRLIAIKLKQEIVHSVSTNVAFQENSTPAGGCNNAIKKTPVRQNRFINRKEIPTAWSLFR